MSLFRDARGDEGRAMQAEAKRQRGREREGEQEGRGAVWFDKWFDSGGQPVYLDLLFPTQSCTNQALKCLAIKRQHKPDNSHPCCFLVAQTGSRSPSEPTASGSQPAERMFSGFRDVLDDGPRKRTVSGFPVH